MTSGLRIGYIGVDVLCDVSVCDEATALLRSGLPLEVVSAYGQNPPPAHLDAAAAPLRAAVRNLFPIGTGELVRALAVAPFVFGPRFWGVLARALFGHVESVRQRAILFHQLIPAVVLALRWRNLEIRHIHAHRAHAAASIAMHAAGLLGVGFSFTGRSDDLFVNRVALTMKVRRARFVVCISEFHRELYEGMGADARRLSVVYRGIDLDRFAVVPAHRESTGFPLIVSAGRLVEKKGFADLVNACALLEDRGIDFECVIAGNGPEHAALEKRIRALGLAGVVRLTNQAASREELPALFASATAFALPCVRDRDGDMDGLPQVLIEALACGVPTVTTRLVGNPDLIVDGRTGLLVEPGDVEGLAVALERLLTNRALGESLGEAGVVWVRDHFGLEEAVVRLGRLFTWAAATDGHGPPPFAFVFPPTSPDDATRVHQHVCEARAIAR